MSEEPEEGGFVARRGDPGTSWAAAKRASDSKLNAIFLQQLYEAGVRGKTTLDMSRDTGIPRDSFSPRFSQNKSKVEAIGIKRELKNGRLCPYTIYRLKIFNPKKPIPHARALIPFHNGQQTPMGLGQHFIGLAQGMPS